MKYNSRSFEDMTEHSTRRRYRDSWKKFTAFLIRSHQLSREAKLETGARRDKTALVVTRPTSNMGHV
ncbi:hypothetical protein V8C42DRAFT_339128 [Trichoderma barbatum]